MSGEECLLHFPWWMIHRGDVVTDVLQTTQPTRDGAVTAIWQIVSIRPAPSNGVSIYRFLTSRTCLMAGTARHKSG